MVRASRLHTILVACMVVVLSLGLAGCGAGEPDSIAPEPPAAGEPPATGDDGTNGDAAAPDGDAARVLVESKCSGCHELARVWAGNYDRAGWETIVTRMEGLGLQVSDDERATIIDYLAEN